FSHNIKDENSHGASDVFSVSASNTRTGHAIADLLLRDLPLSGYTELDHREVALGRWRDFEFYGNDTWKVRPGLTLTAGLRWSRFSPAFSNNNRVTNFVPRLYDGRNFSSALVTADNPGDLPRSLVKPYNGGYQPRIGIAWDVHGDGKTAVRVGFGRFLSRSNVIEDLLRMSRSPPWTVAVSSNSLPGTGATLASDRTLRSLDTIGSGLAANVQGVGATSNFNAVSEDFRPPQSYQWNLTFSHQLMKDTVVEASYVGNHGLHIWRRGINFNDVNPSFRPQIAALIRSGDQASADALANRNRRLPGVTGNVTMSESTGNSTYHG